MSSGRSDPDIAHVLLKTEGLFLQIIVIFTMKGLNKKDMESKEGLNALFLYATEGILVVNDKGTIIRINPSAEKLFGYDPGELLGMKIEALVPRRYNHAHEKQRENYASHPHARSMGKGMDLHGLRKDGSEFPLEISLSPYSSPVEGNCVIAFIVDITIRKQAEDKLKNYSAELERQVKNRTMILEEAIEELERTKKNLNKALNKEKELNELKSRFVSMASHEFRTPLTTMMSSLSLVTKYGQQNDLDNQQKHVNKIKTSINNLTDILNDFLSVSKLEEGKIENVPEVMNLRDFLEDVVGEMKLMKRDSQELKLTFQGEATVFIDKKLLKNVLFNLISNAIKFSPDGKDVEITANSVPSSVKISIKDQGIGISKEDQQHLFERFFRGNNATHIQGTGLGLSIVARYLELMRGTIKLESEENKGTTFIINIPQ